MRALLLCLCVSLCAANVHAEQRLLYLSAGDAVTVYSADTETGKLTEIQKVEGAGTTAITSDQKHLYRIGDGEIASYRIGADGKLALLGAQPTTARGGFLGFDRSDRFIASNDYRGGRVSVWRIGDDHLAKGAPVASMELEKGAHCAVFSPDNRHLLVPATIPNKVFQLKFDSSAATLKNNDPPFVSGPAKSGEAQKPRHLVFHPNGTIVYTTLENGEPGVGVWRWDAAKGSLTRLQNIVTRAEVHKGNLSTADLHLTPDAKFLYVSNRNLHDRKTKTGASTIVGFRVDPETAKLTLLGHTPCPQVPRAFAIDKAGDYVYAAGQVEARLAVYRINKTTGALSKVDEIDTGRGPNWLRCATLP